MRLPGTRGSAPARHVSQGYSDRGPSLQVGGEQPPGPARRREMNRVAQRKFRERQKSTVASLQIELDERDAVVQRMSAQLRALEQTNIVSMHESLNVECTAYDDIILLHSRRYWHQSFSSMSSCTVPFPHAWNCSND